MNAYKPGQSVRFSVTATVLGVLANPANLTLTVHGPDGTTLTPSPVLDSTGAYHADAVIPMDGQEGQWTARWQATGADPADNALVEQRFLVRALDF